MSTKSGQGQAASQIKREDSGAQVIVLEKSGDVSYAACGMPYNLFYKDKPVEDLYAIDLDAILYKRGIDYRLHNDVVAIDPVRKEVMVVDREHSREYRESYDYLVYTSGNLPNRLSLPGFDDALYFKTLDDTRLVKKVIYENAPATLIRIIYQQKTVGNQLESLN